MPGLAPLGIGVFEELEERKEATVSKSGLYPQRLSTLSVINSIKISSCSSIIFAQACGNIDSI